MGIQRNTSVHLDKAGLPTRSGFQCKTLLMSSLLNHPSSMVIDFVSFLEWMIPWDLMNFSCAKCPTCDLVHVCKRFPSKMCMSGKRVTSC